MSKKIAIGMSGGIDSSIAAYLLKKDGNEVIGFTLKLWDDGSRFSDIEDINSAKMLCYKLDIPHYIIDLREEFKKSVVDYFIAEYIKGRTPNPCVVCNHTIKFVKIFEKLKHLDFDYISTGHYARIVKKNGGLFFGKAKDKKKSQEYFLARIEKELLKKIIFPLSDLTKDEVRKISKEIDFKFKDRESQEVCFIKNDESYYQFIMKHSQKKDDFKGNIVDKDGKVLGKHPGYFKYTIGQRQGLGISDKTPYYVIAIDADKKEVVVGKKEDVYKKDMVVENTYWYMKVNDVEKLDVKIRYNHKERTAKVKRDGDLYMVTFSEPEMAVTPGQLAVFYKGDIVVGSGWIRS